MSSLLDERPAVPVRGCQAPRILSYPPYAVSSGPEVVELCASVGLILDPWQQLILTHGLGERDDGQWAAFEVAEVVPRQNGKGDVLMAREIGGLFLLEEDLIIHTAHEFKTSGEAFLRVLSLIENSDELRRKCKKPRLTTGQEAIETLDGRRLKFLARSASSGRGFTGDLIIMDEAQILSDAPIRAMMPTLSAVPNPQIWYAGTAGTEMSVHLGRVRRRGVKGDDPSLAYLEWSVDEEAYDPADPADWARANPTLGIRISADYVAKERAAMDAEGFAAERLGVGDWPVEEAFGVIPADEWAACADESGSRPEMPVCFAVDVNPERTKASIAVAGRRADGFLGVEIADCRSGLDWVVDRAVELVNTWGALAVVIDRGGPAGTLVGPLEAENVTVLVPTPQEVAQAAEGFYDAVMAAQMRHASDPRLDSAVAAAKQRPLGEAWAWGRRGASSDISPLVAASFAVWGFVKEAANLGQPSAWML